MNQILWGYVMSWKFLNNEITILYNSSIKYLSIFFGDIKNYNYIEFFGWLSAAIMTILGLLTIFLSTHYQENILKAKQLLIDFKFETLSEKDLKKKLHEYEYLTTKGMKVYIKAVDLFGHISKITVMMWAIATLVYCLRTESYGGVAIVIVSFLFLVYVLYKIYYMFKQICSSEEIVPFEELLNVLKYEEFYDSGILIGENIIKPRVKITVSKFDESVIIEHLSSLPFYNYSLAIQIKSRFFIFDVVNKVTNPENIELKGQSKDYKLSNRTLNHVLIESMGYSLEAKIYIKGSNLLAYDANIDIQEDGVKYIIGITIKNKDIITIPEDLLTFLEECKEDEINSRYVKSRKPA